MEDEKRKAEIMKLARLIWDLARALHTTPEKVLERLTREGGRCERREARLEADQDRGKEAHRSDCQRRRG